MTHSFYSRHDIDKIIFREYINTPRSDGTFIELGAHDGVHCSNTKFFEDTLGFSGLLIEAVPELYRRLRINRSASNSFYQGAVTSKGSEHIDFLGHNAVAGMPHAMTDKHKEAWHQKKTEEEYYKVKTLRLDRLLSESKIEYVDIFSLDVEGAELEVLETMDWSIPIYILVIEANSGDSHKNNACRRLIEENGLTYNRAIGNNMLFVNSEYHRADILFDKHNIPSAGQEALQWSASDNIKAKNTNSAKYEMHQTLNSQIRISFFGASVTAQGTARNGLKTGYVSHLQDAFRNNTSIKVVKHAFGSNQFRGIGRYELANVLNEEPDVLFFEWHTTSEKDHRIDQWRNSISLCKQCGCIPVILVLPQIGSDGNNQKYQVLKHLSDLAFVLDLRAHCQDKLGNILRDNAHTNALGGELYSSLISTFIKNDIIPAINAGHRKKTSPWLVKEFYDSSMADIGYNKILINHELRDGDSIYIHNISSCSMEYGLFGVKGPQTGNAKVSIEGEKGSKVIQCSDQWCYYSRESLLLKLIVPAWSTTRAQVFGDLNLFKQICPKAFDEPYLLNAPKHNGDFTLFIRSVYYPIHSFPLITLDNEKKRND